MFSTIYLGVIMKLHNNYTSSAVLKLLNVRYGLNPLGIKRMLSIRTRRYNLLVKGVEKLNGREARKISDTFVEMEGRFDYERRKYNAETPQSIS